MDWLLLSTTIIHGFIGSELASCALQSSYIALWDIPKP